MPDLYNYVTVPYYTSSEETEKIRANMKTAVNNNLNQNVQHGGQ